MILILTIKIKGFTGIESKSFLLNLNFLALFKALDFGKLAALDKLNELFDPIFGYELHNGGAEDQHNVVPNNNNKVIAIHS